MKMWPSRCQHIQANKKRPIITCKSVQKKKGGTVSYFPLTQT